MISWANGITAPYLWLLRIEVTYFFGIPGSSPEMTAFRKYCSDHGLYIYTHWHTALIIPPLIITEEQLKEGFAVLDEALKITDQASKH